jgi:hypothetical protein
VLQVLIVFQFSLCSLLAAAAFLQVILRMGKWLRQAMYTHYLSFFKTEGLLAIGDWPYAQQKDFAHYWAERFELHVAQ